MKRVLLLLLSASCAYTIMAFARPALSQVVPPPTEAGSLVTIDVTDAPLRTAFALLFQDSGKRYTIGTFNPDKVSLHFRDASFDTALAALLAASQPPLTYEIDDAGTYKFEHLPPGETSRYIGSSGSFDFVGHVYVIPLAHVPAQYVLDSMRGALTGGLQPVDWQSTPMMTQIDYIIVNKKNNTFLLDATVDGFNFFKEIVKNLDQPSAPSVIRTASPYIGASKHIGRH